MYPTALEGLLTALVSRLRYIYEGVVSLFCLFSL